MQFPDQQGRSAEEAAEYWHKAYWDHMWRRDKIGPFQPLDIQLRSLIQMIYNLQLSNARLSLMLQGRVISTGSIIYLKPEYWASEDVFSRKLGCDTPREPVGDGTISNGRYK